MFWATKVAATDREADRPDPEDLSPTRAEIEVCLADAPQYEEISESLLSLGENKACGWDDVSARILNVDAVKDTMVQIIQQIWAEESLPAQMVQGALVMLHKGGGKSKEDLKAYRPVILLPHCLKCYTNLIMRRMVKHLQQIGRKNASLGVDGGDIVGEVSGGGHSARDGGHNDLARCGHMGMAIRHAFKESRGAITPSATFCSCIPLSVPHLSHGPKKRVPHLYFPTFLTPRVSKAQNEVALRSWPPPRVLR